MSVYDQFTVKEKLKLIEGWAFEDNAIVKNFVFKDFREAMSFMVRTAFICEVKNHHPEWTNVYNKLAIRLSTHDAGGVTDKDLNLAGEINEISSKL
jgi:4a-hydroxytetrahydrobiopterin dehydratase